MWKAKFHYDHWNDSIDWVVTKGRPGNMIVSNGVANMVDPSYLKLEILTTPDFKDGKHVNKNVDPQLLQVLMDSLWERGLRPKDYVSQGVIDRMESHLKDMRIIAFSALKIKRE